MKISPASSPRNGAPTTAVVSSPDTATLYPAPAACLAISFGPTWAHAPAELANSHTAPSFSASVGPPINAIVPSAANAALTPNEPPRSELSSSLGVSFEPCWLQVPPERLKIHAAAGSAPWNSNPSSGPPMSAVLPLADSATLAPNATPTPVSFVSDGVSLPPCCVHDVPDRTKAHAAPLARLENGFGLSPGAPTRAVLPSSERATLSPNWPAPTSPLPVRTLSCDQLLPCRVKT